MKEGWEIKKLGEVCDFQGGSQPPKSQFIYEPQKGFVRFLQIRDFASDKNITYIPESKKNRYCNEEDILLGRYGASVGKVLVNKAGAYNVAVMKTFPNETILYKRYLYYYLNTEDFQTRLLNTASRSAQDGFSKDDIFDFPILIPPLPEQQRIVSILDEAFAAIAKAKANAEQNLKNAKELFESYLQGVFENGDWEKKKIIDLCEGKEHIVGGPFGSNLKVEHYKSSGIPILRLQNIGKGHFIDKDIKYVSKEKAKELEYHSFQSGDLALAKLGIPIGKTCIIPDDFEFGIVVADVVRIRPNKKKVDYNFLNYFLNTNLSVSQLTGNISGATRPRVNLDDVRNIIVSIPSLKEQQTIIRQLDALRAETQKLEAVYQKKIDDLEELKKSILQKAFAGELKMKKAIVI
jgi:type I restriction enzyme S subunit